MLRAARQMLGMGQEGEMSTLLEWFSERCILYPETSYAQLVNDGNVCTAIFYMSPEMKTAFRRNGQFVMIDATCKTNRFGMQLVIFAGSNEIHKSAIFAIGLILTETIVMYKWFLGQCKKAVGRLPPFSPFSAAHLLRCLLTCPLLCLLLCGFCGLLLCQPCCPLLCLLLRLLPC
jgi:hypothetical protein